MDAIPPVVADAFSLHRDLYGHLDEAEFLAMKSHALVKDPDREFVALLRRAHQDD